MEGGSWLLGYGWWRMVDGGWMEGARWRLVGGGRSGLVKARPGSYEWPQSIIEWPGNLHG